MIGLWNNFHERAAKEGLQRPSHPLYFLKANNCFAAHGEAIRRPPGYDGMVVFEAELGIVIGRRASCIDVATAPDAIFGYTCVNDVTARDLMRLDPAFVHWTRAKSFDSFGPFGPADRHRPRTGRPARARRDRRRPRAAELPGERHVLFARRNRQQHFA
jgi:2-keto-4-pentenoate hydratase/2-oxohepta-3-ene-1,7-dioic acid hydratase in catechol pathway